MMGQITQRQPFHDPDYLADHVPPRMSQSYRDYLRPEYRNPLRIVRTSDAPDATGLVLTSRGVVAVRG